jgi:cytoskeletal protein CcmA (bactofilin family)
MWPLNDKKKILEQDENFTFLGRGVDFKGVVNFEGTVRIDGRLEGEIHTKGTLVVGECAVIKGIVTAGTLTCGGKIKGNITATERVQLLKSAIIMGDVRTPSISIEDGAHVHGMCEMGAHKWVEKVEHPPLVPEVLENVHDLSARRGKMRVQDLQSS